MPPPLISPTHTNHTLTSHIPHTLTSHITHTHQSHTSSNISHHPHTPPLKHKHARAHYMFIVEHYSHVNCPFPFPFLTLTHTHPLPHTHPQHNRIDIKSLKDKGSPNNPSKYQCIPLWTYLDCGNGHTLPISHLRILLGVINVPITDLQ